MEDKKYTAQEIADLFGLTKPAIYLWKKDGLEGEMERIPGRKKRVVYTMKNLMDFFQVESVEQLFKEKSRIPYPGKKSV